MLSLHARVFENFVDYGRKGIRLRFIRCSWQHFASGVVDGAQHLSVDPTSALQSIRKCHTVCSLLRETEGMLPRLHMVRCLRELIPVGSAVLRLRNVAVDVIQFAPVSHLFSLVSACACERHLRVVGSKVGRFHGSIPAAAQPGNCMGNASSLADLIICTQSYQTIREL